MVFLLDNSGSMRRGELETVNIELLSCIERLAPEQEFYVIFFSDTVYPMFYPQSTDKFIRPTERNKERLREWLDTVEFCTGNMVHKAMEAAAALRPDVVFLLSDGDVRTTSTGYRLQYLLNADGREFKVHTLGMGCKKDEHRGQLAAIAESHGGTFREVAVLPAMVQIAIQHSRPYYDYNTGPGPVWGRAVPKR